jgi:beta-glucosidase
MGAYNRLYGASASASELLLEDILREKWGFDGYVVSDCDSIEDIFKYHKIVKTPEQAAALGIKNGTELNCGKTYAALVNAVKQGLITEAEIDASLVNLMKTRFELGMFDPPERVRWANIPYSVNQSAEHDWLARRAAQSSMVLLRNSGVLPLSKDIGTIAVVGPTADEVMSLLGNYYGTPAAPVTILQGIRQAVGKNTKVLYSRGADLVEGREEPRAAPAIEPAHLRPAAGASEQGLKGEYFNNRDLSGTPVMSRVDQRISFRWDRGGPIDDLISRGEFPADAIGSDNFSVRWTGQLVPPVSGRYELSVGANDGFRLFVNGKQVIESWDLSARVTSKSAFVNLEAGKPVDVRLEYFEDIRDAEVRFGWRLPGSKPPLEEALEAARAADVIVFVGGLTGDVEGEEMKVNYPGFAGGDRTDLRLPGSQRRLLEALHKTGKPVVAVLTAGSALAVDWAQTNLPAILVAWYPGQRGGNAVADVLFGDANPAGRLPVTFYKANEKMPRFDDYNMQNRTYRYFKGEPLYPFGHGLSYTSFEYSELKLDRSQAGAKDEITATLRVKNVGSRTGDEVVQLYVRPVSAKQMRAIKELRGIERFTLRPGESREVSFTLNPEKDITYYDTARDTYAVASGAYEIELGASSADIRLKAPLQVSAQ